jgi:hypothetical protein
MSFGVNLQGGVDALLELLALRLEPREHVGINVERDRNFLRGQTQPSISEKRLVERLNVGGVDLFVRHLFLFISTEVHAPSLR